MIAVRWILGLVLVALNFHVGVAAGQQLPSVGDVPNAVFQDLVSDREVIYSLVPEFPEPSNEELMNGIPVSAQYFPTIFRMTTGGTCTAALIGESALLTAAHCVRDGALVSFVVSEEKIRGICERAPGYDRRLNESEDWALCLLEYPIRGIAYETVDIANVPESGDRVVLTGYGCTREGGPLDGQLRLGVSKVVNADAVRFRQEISTIYTESSVAGGGATLCPGDSGGPLFDFLGNTVADARSIVGVNSRTTFERGVSLFAATGSEAGRQFIIDWAEKRRQLICGVNTSENCF